MSYVVVVTKPSHTRIILPLIRRMHPGRRIVGVLDGSMSLLGFRYPRGLSMAEYPFVSDPVWRPSDERIERGHRVYEFVDGQRVTLEADPFETLRDAEAVICAEGDWYGGAANFDMLLRHSGGSALADRPHPVVPWLRHNQVDRPIEEQGIGSTHDADFTRLRDGGLAKRRFDWCFAVNSQALLGAAFRQATGRQPDRTIGKNSLQLLYAMREMEPRRDGPLIGTMVDWAGTGRYARTRHEDILGSAMSRVQILEDLVDIGLVERTPGSPGRSPMTSISDAGRRFLDLLHPDCRDPDQPFRIREWQLQGTDSHAAIDRYIRTFFGKQKRFMARQGRA